MKKIALISLIASVCSVVANADIYRETVNTCDADEMRAALDRAAADKRSVITVIECDNGIIRTTIQQPRKVVAAPVAPKTYKACGCGCDKKEEVVNREYFVRETVQTYKPVVTYVPDGTYTRVKPACNHGC